MPILTHLKRNFTWDSFDLLKISISDPVFDSRCTALHGKVLHVVPGIAPVLHYLLFSVVGTYLKSELSGTWDTADKSVLYFSFFVFPLKEMFTFMLNRKNCTLQFYVIFLLLVIHMCETSVYMIK